MEETRAIVTTFMSTFPSARRSDLRGKAFTSADTDKCHADERVLNWQVSHRQCPKLPYKRQAGAVRREIYPPALSRLLPQSLLDQCRGPLGVLNSDLPNVTCAVHSHIKGFHPHNSPYAI